MQFLTRTATRLPIAALLVGLAASACYNDNASPFAHGAHNAPPAMGSTSVKEGSKPTRMTETTSTGGYGNSSGYAGGIVKETSVTAPADAGATSTTPTTTAAATPAP